MPRFTAVCSTAASHFRQPLGHVLESSVEPTAHSPPMPSAAGKRKIRRCKPSSSNSQPSQAAMPLFYWEGDSSLRSLASVEAVCTVAG